MSKVAHGRVLVSQNGAESYRGQSSWSLVLLGRREQSSSWSVALRGWCLYSMVVMHTCLLRHMARENRGQCLDKCTGVGRTRVGGHETRPKPKPNVDYYLVTYYYYYYHY